MHISFKGVFECGNYRATGSKSMKTDRCCCSLRIPEVVVVVAGLVVDLVDFVGKLIQCRKIPILEMGSVLDMKRDQTCPWYIEKVLHKYGRLQTVELPRVY